MTTTNDMADRFEDAERGLEWLEKLEALQARSASDRAALDVAEYVMKLRAAVTALAGERTGVGARRGRGCGDGAIGGGAATGGKQRLLEYADPARVAEVGWVSSRARLLWWCWAAGRATFPGSCVRRGDGGGAVTNRAGYDPARSSLFIGRALPKYGIMGE